MEIWYSDMDSRLEEVLFDRCQFNMNHLSPPFTL